jgi:type III secretory pathway component EscT
MQQQCLLVLALNLKRPAIVVMAEAHVFVGVVMIMAKKKKCLKNN